MQSTFNSFFRVWAGIIRALMPIWTATILVASPLKSQIWHSLDAGLIEVSNFASTIRQSAIAKVSEASP